MVGDFIPEDDEHWQLFLQMMDIVDHLFSPNLSAEHAVYVGTLIREHHKEFRRLYPHQSIIPKMHFMIHMPRLIREQVFSKIFVRHISISYMLYVGMDH